MISFLKGNANIMIKNIKKIVKSRPIIAKVLILVAITTFMFVGPTIFTLVYHIQSKQFHEKALEEVIVEGGLDKANANFVLTGDK